MCQYNWCKKPIDKNHMTTLLFLKEVSNVQPLWEDPTIFWMWYNLKKNTNLQDILFSYIL